MFANRFRNVLIFLNDVETIINNGSRYVSIYKWMFDHLRILFFYKQIVSQINAPLWLYF